MTLKPDIDKDGEFPDIKTVNTIIEKVHLTIYSPLSCVRPEKKSEYNEKYDMFIRGGVGLLRQTDREAGLVNLMRTNLLKRLESSVNSFFLSVDRLIKSIDKMLDALNIEKDDFMDDLNINDVEIDDEELQDLFIGNKIKVLIQDLDHIKIKQRLNDDKEKLLHLLEESLKIDPKRDAKLQQLKDIIKDKINNPINNNNKKILIFTAYSDTASYLYDEMAPWIKRNFGLYTAEVNGSRNCRTTLKNIKSDYNTILTFFSPVSKERKSLYQALSFLS
jgi:DNA-binding protein